MGGKNYPGDEQRKMEKRCWEKRENFKGRRGRESCDKVREVAKRSVRGGGGGAGGGDARDDGVGTANDPRARWRNGVVAAASMQQVSTSTVRLLLFSAWESRMNSLAAVGSCNLSPILLLVWAHAFNATARRIRAAAESI